MRFTDPIWLLLLVPAFAGLWFTFKHVHGMAKGRKRIAFGIRFLLVTLLILALSGPEARRSNKGIATMFLLDRSDSIKGDEAKRAEEFVSQAMQKLGPEDVA